MSMGFCLQKRVAGVKGIQLLSTLNYHLSSNKIADLQSPLNIGIIVPWA